MSIKFCFLTTKLVLAQKLSKVSDQKEVLQFLLVFQTFNKHITSKQLIGFIGNTLVDGFLSVFELGSWSYLKTKNSFGLGYSENSRKNLHSELKVEG